MQHRGRAPITERRLASRLGCARCCLTTLVRQLATKARSGLSSALFPGPQR